MSSFQIALCQFLILVSSAIRAWPSVDIPAHPLSSKAIRASIGITVTETPRSRPGFQMQPIEGVSQRSRDSRDDVGVCRQTRAIRAAASEGFPRCTGSQAGRRIHSKETRMLRPDAPAPPATRAKRLHNLDDIYLRLSRGPDYVRLREIVTNVGIDGSPSSGKTSGPFETLQRAAWRHGDAGLVLCAKPDSAERATKIIKAAGEEDRLIVVSPDSGHVFNPVDYALQHAKGEAMIDEALHELWTMVEILNRGEVSKQGDAFFDPGGKEMVRHIMAVQLERYGKIDVLRVLKCIQVLPPDFAALENSERYPILDDLEQAIASMQGRDNDALDMAFDYFKKAIPNLASKTRSSLQMTAQVRLAPLFGNPILRMCFKKGTPVSPDEIVFGGKIVVLDVSYSQYFAASRALGAAWKQATQKAAMRRQATHKGDERELLAVGIWADECQCWLTDFDVEAAERGRSSRLYHVYAWQSWGSLKRGYGGDESKAEALTASIGVRIMCQQKDFPTRKRNSEMVGTSDFWMDTHGTSVTQGSGMSGPSSSSGVSNSQAIQTRPVLPEEAFLTLGVKRGVVEAFVFPGGSPFLHNDQRFLRTEFTQMDEGRRLAALTEKRPRARSWVGYTEPKNVALAFFKGWEQGERAFRNWLNFWREQKPSREENGGNGHAQS